MMYSYNVKPLQFALMQKLAIWRYTVLQWTRYISKVNTSLTWHSWQLYDAKLLHYYIHLMAFFPVQPG